MKISEKTKKIIVLSLLCMIIVYHVATNIWFLESDGRPCNINELSHVIGAIDFLNLLQDQEDPYSAYLQAFNGYPPAGIAATLFYWIAGREHVSAQLSQLLFSVLLAFTLYGIGARLYDRPTGLLAVFLCLTAPASCEVSRQYLLEWSLTATSTAAAYFLFVSDGFSKRKPAITAGLFVGSAALCKQTFLIFLAGPLLFAGVIWLQHVFRGNQPGEPSPKKERKALRITGAVLAFPAAFLFSWLIYTGRRGSAIDNWFWAVHGGHTSWSLIFLTATTVILGTGLLLLCLKSSPAANGPAAGLLAIFIASLWYFPKGLMNFLTYYNQMQLNVEKSQMSPETLLKFYTMHLETYYLGPVLLWIVITAAAVLVLLAALSPLLKRYYNMKELLPGRSALLFPLLWLAIPAAAFFFINIQNEMNTVPLLPPLYLAVATMITRIRLPFNQRTQHSLEAGKPLIRVRGLRAMVAVLMIALVGIASFNGWVTSWVFPTKDGYKALPCIENKILAQKLAPRKFNDLNYIEPRPQTWHDQDIMAAMIANTHIPRPRLLIMDVAFYFSWNTFWYLYKLEHRPAEIQTQWYDDRDIINGLSDDAELFSYDLILYRMPYRKIYADAYNDYIDYKHLWKTFALLADPPEVFRERYTEVDRWSLPDQTTAILLVKNNQTPHPDPVAPPE